MEQLRGTVARNEEEKQRLEAELIQVKEMLQREVARADAESRRSNIIIAEYKQVYILYLLYNLINFINVYYEYNIYFRFVNV